MKAKLSTPSTLTFPTSGKGTALILLSKASRAATMPSSRASLALQGDRQQGLLKHHGLAGAGSDLLKPLAEEAPRQDLELDGDAVPGQIRDRAKVAAVHPRGSATAQRADASPRAGRYADAGAPGLDAQALEVQALRQQFVGRDSGPHAGTTPYPARWSLTVRLIHHERDRTRVLWRGLPVVGSQDASYSDARQKRQNSSLPPGQDFALAKC